MAQGIVFNGSSQYATFTSHASYGYIANHNWANFEFRLRSLRTGFASDQCLMDFQNLGKLMVNAVSAGVTNLQWRPTSGSGTVTLAITGRSDMLLRLIIDPLRLRYGLQVWNLNGTNTTSNNAATTDTPLNLTSKTVRVGANRSAGEFTQVTIDFLHWSNGAHSIGQSYVPFPAMTGYTYLPRLGLWNFESGAETADTGDAGGQTLTLTGSPTYSTTPNVAPIANAGPDQTGASLGYFWLDGHGSYDVEGDHVENGGLSDTVTWTQTSGPSCTIENATKFSTRVQPSTTGTYVFSLTVTDTDGTPLTSASDSVSVTVVNPSASLTVPSTGWVGEPVIIDASASTGWGGNGGLGSILITLGDGPTTDPNYQQHIDKCCHSYLQAGTYTVTATITNAAGTTSQDSKNIVISDIPAATGGNSDPLTDQGSAAANQTALQTAINTAAAATSAEREIILPAGVTYNNITLPAITGTKSGSKYITIKSSALASLTAGKRVSLSDLSNMPRIQSISVNVPALDTATNIPTNHWRLQGIEFYSSSTQDLAVVNLGRGDVSQQEQTSTSQEPHHVIFDRCVAHGTSTSETKACIRANAAYVSVIDSYLSDGHKVGADAQAFCVTNGEGPFSLVNSYFEGSGENIFFGGSVPSIEGLVPADIEVRRSYIFKPLTWKSTDPSYAGTAWTIKNLFELKNAVRVQITGNILRNCWVQAQTGDAIIFNTAYDSGDWALMTDVAFTFNYVSKMAGAWLIKAHDFQDQIIVSRLLIKHNVFDDISQSFSDSGSSGFTGKFGGAPNTVFVHNTSLNETGGAMMYVDYYRNTQSNFSDNIMRSAIYCVFGSGGLIGNTATNRFMPGGLWLKNIINSTNFDAGSQLPNAANNYNAANDAAIGFTDLANKDYRLTVGSTYHNGGTDGTDPGANISDLTTAIGASGTAFSSATFNAITGIWSTVPSGNVTVSNVRLFIQVI